MQKWTMALVSKRFWTAGFALYLMFGTELAAKSSVGMDTQQKKCMLLSQEAVLGTEVLHGVDVKQMSDAQMELLKEQLLLNGVVVLRNQSLTHKEQIEFTLRFGRVIALPPSMQSKDVVDGYPEIQRVSNYWSNGTWKGTQHCFGCYWHKDGDFRGPDEDFIASILYAHELSSLAAPTGFLDNCFTSKLLPPTLKSAIRDTVVTISVRDIPDFKNGTEKDLALFPHRAERAIFHKHPGNGRECLYLNLQLSTKVKPNVEVEANLRDAWEFLTTRSPMYIHQWQQGDIVVWDNLGVMHRAMGSKEVLSTKPRTLFRTQVSLYDPIPRM